VRNGFVWHGTNLRVTSKSAHKKDSKIIGTIFFILKVKKTFLDFNFSMGFRICK